MRENTSEAWGNTEWYGKPLRVEILVKIRKEARQQKKGVSRSVGKIFAQYGYFMLLWNDLRWQVWKEASVLCLFSNIPRYKHTGLCFIRILQLGLRYVFSWSLSASEKVNDEISVSSFKRYTLLISWAATLISNPFLSAKVLFFNHFSTTQAELSVCVRSINEWICQIWWKTSNHYDNFKTVLCVWERERLEIIMFTKNSWGKRLKKKKSTLSS